jgi:hypothetical protein
LAYDPNSYDMQICMRCPSANRPQPPPPCQSIQKYMDGSVVPIAREDISDACPFAASWETIKRLALKYPNIPRSSSDGFYAIGKIRASMEQRKSITRDPSYLQSQMDPALLKIFQETGRTRLTWQDDSNGRFYYFLQAVSPGDYARFEEWYKLSRIGPVPSDLAGKIEWAVVRSGALISAAARSQVQSMLSWENLLIMAGSMTVIALAALAPVTWPVFVRTVLVPLIGALPIALQVDATLAKICYNVSGASSRSDLERAAQGFADLWVQLATAAVLFAFFKGLSKGRQVWETQKTSAAGETFYKPKERVVQMVTENGRQVAGVTRSSGDIEVSYIAHLEGDEVNSIEMYRTLMHERVHSWLSPKFFLFRDARIAVNDWGYSNVALLRLLEEAMAQTYANCKVDGVNFGSIFQGLKFPFQHKEYLYLTHIDRAISEFTGAILVGYFMVHGDRWKVSRGD